MDYIHRTDIQLRFNDIDRLGHVYNGIFSHYFDLARMNYFREVTGREPDWKNFALVMASSQIEYMSPVYPEESILVLSRTEVLGEKSLTMVQEIINHPENEQKVFNRSVMVGYSAESRSTIEIPLEIKDKIMEFEKEVKVKKVSLNPDQRSLREN